MSLADALDRAADALPDLAEVIRPANGDAARVLEALDGEKAASVLAWMLAEAPDDAGELAAEWAGEEAGFAALSSIDEASLPKPGRKALRRVRHRLRSQGIVLPEAPAAPKVATLPEVEPDVEGAFVSPLDPGGSRAIVIVQANPSGGARIFELVANDWLGIQSCDVFKASRGKAKRFLREATQVGSGAGVMIEVDAARVMVARAAERQPKDRALPRSFSEWRSQIAAAPEGVSLPGDEAAAAFPETDAEDRARLLEMIEQNQIGPWPPLEEPLKETVDRLNEARDAKVVVAGGTQGRFEEILEDAAEAAYDEAFSACTAARFEESAYLFWKLSREPEARACLAGARSFREGEARSNPVARALLGRLLAPLMQEKEEEESESLLVKP
ncbi:MAG: hypothetical protein JRH10_12485 [Deltaproteobacteria bacterium]|nr:hypothetical protein [Deltaproteobacteria bacterium]MBW2446481.1 hypothetical protein [Deltaproteobacteria bacterium]